MYICLQKHVGTGRHAHKDRSTHVSTCMYVHNSPHRCTQGYTPRVQTEMHTPPYAHAHVLTHVPLTSCNLEKTPGVRALRLQIKGTKPTNPAKECHLVVASGPGLRQAAFSFLWARFFLEPLRRWANTTVTPGLDGTLGQALSHPSLWERSGALVWNHTPSLPTAASPGHRGFGDTSLPELHLPPL